MSPNLLLYFKFGQTWSETKTLQIFLESFCVYSPVHASFYFYRGSSGLSSLYSLEPAFLHCGVHFCFPRSHSDLPFVHLDSLPPHDLVLRTDGSVPFPFGKGGSGILANCSLCGTEATLSFSAGPIWSSYSAEACAILQALCWSRQQQQVWHFSSPPI